MKLSDYLQKNKNKIQSMETIILKFNNREINYSTNNFAFNLINTKFGFNNIKNIDITLNREVLIAIE